MVAPFPFDRLPAVTREDAAALRRVARALPPAEGVAERAEALLGARLTVQPDVLHRCPPGELRASLGDPVAAVVLGSSSPGARIVLELSPELAEWGVLRVLGAEADTASGRAPLSDLERGVLAWTTAHLLGAGEWQVLDVLRAPSALVACLGDEGSVVWSAQLRWHMGETTLEGVARIWVPDGVTLPEAVRPIPAGLPLTLTIEVGVATLLAQECAELVPGDVVLLDEHFPPAGTEGGTEAGTTGARLRAVGSRRGALVVSATERGWRVERWTRGLEAGRTRARSAERGATMSDGTDDGDTLATVGDAPIELSIEVARFAMTLDELARLRPGEVLASGQALGEKVTLRAGDRAIARGELVQVDGEIGIRITALTE